MIYLSSKLDGVIFQVSIRRIIIVILQFIRVIRHYTLKVLFSDTLCSSVQHKRSKLILAGDFIVGASHEYIVGEFLPLFCQVCRQINHLSAKTVFLHARKIYLQHLVWFEFEKRIQSE